MLCNGAGANAVEFIINHAEVSIAFIQEKKLPAVRSMYITIKLIRL